MEYPTSFNTSYPNRFFYGSIDVGQYGTRGVMPNGNTLNPDLGLIAMEPNPRNFNNPYTAGGIWVPLRYVPEVYAYLPVTEPQSPNYQAPVPLVIPPTHNIKKVPFYDQWTGNSSEYSRSLPRTNNTYMDYDKSNGFGYLDRNKGEEHFGPQFFKHYKSGNNSDLTEAYEPNKNYFENIMKNKEKLYNSNEKKKRYTSDSCSISSSSQTCSKPNYGCSGSERSRTSTKKGGNLPLSLLQRFSKTKMCLHQSEGICTRGENCPFAHTENEIRLPPNLYKTKMCEHIKDGVCPSGNSCRFAHSEQELKSTPEFYKTSICTLFEIGECHRKESCRFAHGVQELRQRSHNIDNSNCSTEASSTDEITTYT